MKSPLKVKLRYFLLRKAKALNSNLFSFHEVFPISSKFQLPIPCHIVIILPPTYAISEPGYGILGDLVFGELQFFYL